MRLFHCYLSIALIAGCATAATGYAQERPKTPWPPARAAAPTPPAPAVADTVMPPPEALVVGLKPDGMEFKLKDKFDQPTYAMTEWTPVRESVDHWSQMITIMSGKGEPQLDTLQLIAKTVEGFKKDCTNVQVLENTSHRQIDAQRQIAGLPADYQTYDVLVACDVSPAVIASDTKAGRSTLRHEVVWFKGLQGWSTWYLVQRAWHGDTIPPNTILTSDAVRGAWRSWADAIGFCCAPAPSKP